MRALDMALAHVAQGSGYSWDLSTLIGAGIAVSPQLRKKLLAGETTVEDADFLRALLSELRHERQ